MTRVFLSLLPCAIAFLMATANNSDNLVLNQIRSHHKGVAIWWTGNAGWLIKSDNVLVGTDLTLDNNEKVQPPPVTASEIATDLDVLFVTHHHGDHCNSE